MKNLFGRFSPYFGGALGLLGVVLTVYIFWYQEYAKTGEITLFVNAQGNVLTVQREVPDLDIVYRGNSLVKEGKALRFFSVQLRNTGQQHILKTYFDDQVPWGFRLDGAEILRITSISESAPALANVRPVIESGNTVRLTPVNFDIGDWIQIDFLALADSAQSPDFQMLGRVSGTIQKVRVESPGAERSLVEQAFYGSTWIQVIRTIAYAILFVVTVIFFVGIVSSYYSVLEKLQRIKRERVIGRVEYDSDRVSVESRKAINELYLKGGLSALASLRAILVNEVIMKAMEEALAKYATSTNLPKRLRRQVVFANVLDRLRDIGAGIYNTETLRRVAFAPTGKRNELAIAGAMSLVEQLAVEDGGNLEDVESVSQKFIDRQSLVSFEGVGDRSARREARRNVSKGTANGD